MNRKFLNVVLFVLILWLGTQIVYLDHVAMSFLQEISDVRSSISIHLLETVSGKPTRYDSVCYVGQVKIVAFYRQSSFVSGNKLSDPICVESQFRTTAGLRLLNLVTVLNFNSSCFAESVVHLTFFLFGAVNQHLSRCHSIVFLFLLILFTLYLLCERNTFCLVMVNKNKLNPVCFESFSFLSANENVLSLLQVIVLAEQTLFLSGDRMLEIK